MSTSLGRLCLVLHGHLPYVLHHGVWPHGESWLFEGAAETYLPLLELLDELAGRDLRFGLTVGLTPVLLEQLAHGHFKDRFVAYLHERGELARHDARSFDAKGEHHLAGLARRWEAYYADRLAAFERFGRDLPGAFARHRRDGRIEILTSAATHAYLPLLSTDAAVNAQLRAGAATSERHLGVRPRGLWLPECAYRPAEPAWQPPVLYRAPMDRPGLEDAVAAVGVDHVFVDTHLVAHAIPLAVTNADGTEATNDAMIYWDAKRGWGSPLEPVGIASAARRADVFAMARHPRVSEQVWSAVTGYPGADDYLEFHRKHGDHGLRYHRVTSHHTPALEKSPYDPARTAGKAYEQAQHFCSVLRETLTEYTRQTGRVGTIVAPFDAELFGHWWFEGLSFLRDVLLTLAHDGTVAVVTSAEALRQSTLDKVARLPEGSWGEGGGHHVWLNEPTRWLWESVYRAEARFLQLLRDLPWRTNDGVAAMLRRAGRELLLMQASDWPFVIHSAAAADYGVGRFAGHVTRFDRLCTIAADVAAGRGVDAVRQTEVAEADAHDVIFADVDLAWWG
jgi:1,4-alpha-glucan branching enzyme